MPKTVRLLVSGRVQGVSYRAWTVQTAHELGLQGWVRNRSDGTVEAVFSGDEAQVDMMYERCKQGPTSARVEGIEVFACDEKLSGGFVAKSTL